MVKSSGSSDTPYQDYLIEQAAKADVAREVAKAAKGDSAKGGGKGSSGSGGKK